MIDPVKDITPAVIQKLDATIETILASGYHCDSSPVSVHRQDILQALGFTQEHVAVLKTLCLSDQYESHESKAVHEFLNCLAALIKALLP